MENFDSAKSSLKDSTEMPKFDNTFGKNIFNAVVMEDYIEERYIQNYMDFMNGKCKIAQETLEKLAEGMLNWAIKNNATHYSHWFQPITNSVAEKHESFITLNPLTNEAIFKFNWKNLLKQESDASCFPHNSKVKNYCVSRGYTAWDPSTFVFIYDNVLYIPAVFISHDEHALDHKIPLLKAESKLKKHATKFMKLFNADVLEVQTMLGWKQEFYLLDKNLVEKRIDLLQLNKTIVGSSLISEQKMDDYCFGSINKKVKNFLSEVEYQCNILGILLKTRYKKEAINQYEFSHSYEKVNVATDHNVLLMNIMKKVAYDQGLKVIFHEIPFKNSKSSSKFCNFSFLTNEGLNLFDCGDTLEERVRFFSFLCIFLKAVNDNKDLLTSSVISYESEVQKHESNKHSSVVSVYLGENFTLMLEDLEKNTNFDFLNEQEKKNEYHSVIENIPKFLKEDYNKNKTATLAFLGNRFVFRSVGSEQNCAKPMTMLISILANQIKLFLSELDLLVKNENLSVKDAIFKISREYFLHSKNIIYNQDKHPEEFLSNEEKSELMNRDCEIEKFKLLKSEKVISLFSSLNVLSKEEIFLRHDIEMETYLIKLETESKILYEVISSHVIPSAIKYQNILLENFCKIKENNFDFEYSIYQPETIRKINYHITILHTQLKDLNKNLQEMNKLSLEDRMNTARKILKNNFKEIKTSSEELELIVDDKIWPLVKYKEYFRDL